MKIYNYLTTQTKPLSLALGYFDGIHKGHQKVISQAVKLKSLGLTPSVLTFNQNSFWNTRKPNNFSQRKKQSTGRYEN